MADYKELLRRAIAALPENNGAARRAVYEKARSALVGQLRAITPPLPARDITQHRLQLEDCIRQVEQEASEAVISLGREQVLAARPAAAPVQPASAAVVEAPKPVPIPTEPTRPVVVATPAAAPAPAGTMSIEDIISQASAATDGKDGAVEPNGAVAAAPQPKPDSRVMPAIVAPMQATKAGPTSPVPQPAGLRSADTSLKSPSFEPRRDAVPVAANSPAEPVSVPSRAEPSLGNQAAARQQEPEEQSSAIAMPASVPIEAALSSVREVEVEVEPGPNESQHVIERAIEVLDREARGEPTPPLPDPADRSFALPAAESDNGDAGFADATAQRGAGLTIFLVVFALLLAGVGGAGFWAWREGYVDFDQMFGQASAPVIEATDTTTTTPTLDPVLPTEIAVDAVAGPGNTAPAATSGEANAVLSGLEGEDRLTPTPVQVTGNESVLPGLDSGEIKGEERLSGDTTALAAADPAASVDPVALAGSQSLLLEASQDGTSGAVPFSGTVEWSEGVDDLGLPTLIGTASIPARNMGVDITIRKNSDPSLPASHLMEVDFKVSDTFIGGTIATLPGVLLKDEELVPGTALVGASARVVGNSFLFALSATPADAATNTELLENRRWMDLAVVYGTGRNAIITLEKDDEAQALFDKVFTAWK